MLLKTCKGGGENRAKALRELGETIEKVISHRPLRMLTTVGMNMRIDRYTCS